MTNLNVGIFGKLASGAVETVVIGACLTKQVVNWLVNINRIRILRFTERHYPEEFRQLDGGDKRVLRAFLDPESLSNTWSLLVGDGALNAASEYRLNAGQLIRLLQDTMGTEATFDNSFVENVPDTEQDDFPAERWFFINGIATSREMAESNATELHALFGRRLTMIHNPTQGLTNDLLESAMQKFTNVNTEPVARAFVEIGEALLHRDTTKVVVIAHSQGTIITGDVLDLLYLSIDKCFFDRTNMNDQDLREFLTISSGTVKSAELRRLSARLKDRKDVLEKLELYMFANAASRMCYADATQQWPHIESYANEHDIVTRLGSLARDDFHREDLIRIDGSLFTRKRSGHLLNAHYLPDFVQDLYGLSVGLHDEPCIGTSIHDPVEGNPGTKHPKHKAGPSAPRLRTYLRSERTSIASHPPQSTPLYAE